MIWKMICWFFVLMLVSVTCGVNVQVEYFTSATILCDDVTLNLTKSSQDDVKSKYWITPFRPMLDNTSVPGTNRQGDKDWELGDWLNYNLTVNYVNDEDFGIYYCVIVRNDFTINVVKQSINIDGPSYEKLYTEYRHNAMVGGIAAGVLFAVVFGTCAIWHFRFASRKDDKNGKEGIEYNTNGYDNVGLNVNSSKSALNDDIVVTTEKL